MPEKQLDLHSFQLDLPISHLSGVGLLDKDGIFPDPAVGNYNDLISAQLGIRLHPICQECRDDSVTNLEITWPGKKDSHRICSE